MDAPTQFVSDLTRAFEGRVRVRWSKKTHEWHFEQKVGRAALPTIHISEIDDDRIRERDGYVYIFAVRPGTSMPCPVCNHTLAVPALKFAEVSCGVCAIQGKNTAQLAAYFPLGDLLIDHLRMIAPERSSRRRLEEMDRRNAQRNESKRRDAQNYGDSALLDRWNRIVGIEQVGYTGKELRA